MRFFGICLLILGLASISKGSRDQHDSDDSFVEDLKHFPETSEDDMPEFPPEDTMRPDLDGYLPEDVQDHFEGLPPHDLDYAFPEDFQDDLHGPPPHDFQERFHDDFPPEDLDGSFRHRFEDDFEQPPTNDLVEAPQEVPEEVYREALQESFRMWNADVKACDGDVICLAEVNNGIRPIVNEAADNGVLPVIEPCEDRVGTYEVVSTDGWIIEAVLPC